MSERYTTERPPLQGSAPKKKATTFYPRTYVKSARVDILGATRSICVAVISWRGGDAAEGKDKRKKEKNPNEC